VSVTTAKTVTDISIAVAVIFILFALLEQLPGIFGDLGKAISDALKKSVGDGAAGLGKTAAETAGKAVGGTVSGAVDAGQSLWDQFKGNFVKFGSKDPRTPLDTNSADYGTYYSTYIEPGAVKDVPREDDGTPNFFEMMNADPYAIDSKGNILNEYGQLVSFNPANL
jgi:hypothetical protein